MHVWGVKWRKNMKKGKCDFRLVWEVFFVFFITASMWGAGESTLSVFRGDSVMDMQSEFILIDDFSKSGGLSSFGTEWRMFTDRVMGGRSTADWRFETINERRCVHLWGDVSLANNGGFIQVALPLTRNGKAFNAGSYSGVRLWVRGNGEKYHVHLRSRRTRFPWQYYGAGFVAGDSWSMIELPFSDFNAERLKARLNSDKLTRIAVVAIGEEVKADVAVARIEFYR